jgi:LPS export ABC transporter protein LptC
MKTMIILKACAIALITTTISGCDESPKVMPNTVNVIGFGADKPSQISYNTSMNFSNAGMLRAILHAKRVETYDTKHYTWLDSGVRVDFYDREGLHSSVLTSLTARVNSINNNMTAYGHVHIVSDSGTTVDTDSLEWINQTQIIHSDAPVHIVEKNGRITNGIGFESDQNLAHYQILRPTIEAPSGTFQPNGTTSPNSSTSLRPAQPLIPGAGAIPGSNNGRTELRLPSIQDTAKILER